MVELGILEECKSSESESPWLIVAKIVGHTGQILNFYSLNYCIMFKNYPLFVNQVLLKYITGYSFLLRLNAIFHQSSMRSLKSSVLSSHNFVNINTDACQYVLINRLWNRQFMDLMTLEYTLMTLGPSPKPWNKIYTFEIKFSVLSYSMFMLSIPSYMSEP